MKARVGARHPDATGTLAFLFTDIAGSTRLWERLPQAMKAALERHDVILHESIEASAGRVIKTTGDGMMAVFPTAVEGVTASVAAQLALAAEPWHETGRCASGMGLHAGDAERRGDDYFGPTINRTARIMSAGHGGQVLLEQRRGPGCGPPPGWCQPARPGPEYRLKDLGRPERVFQLVHPALEGVSPPLTTLDHGAASLPVPTAPFVGRRVEARGGRPTLWRIPSVRLLTLTGPGGTGKTSLGSAPLATRSTGSATACRSWTCRRRAMSTPCSSPSAAPSASARRPIVRSGRS